MKAQPESNSNNTPSGNKNVPENANQAHEPANEDWASRLSLQTNATVSEMLTITEGLHILRITPDKPVSFLPGQHTVITLDTSDPATSSPTTEQTTVEGYFSIASSPSAPESLEFLVNTRSNSELSSKISSLVTGDRISVDPNIRGNLHLHGGEGFNAVSPDRNLIMIATGTGIAPMMSILRSEDTWTPGRSITLIHGVRGIDDSAYLPELLQLERTRDFSYIPSPTRQDIDESILSGRLSIDAIKEATRCDASTDCILICGHFELVGQLKEGFRELGFSDARDRGDERSLITE
jgi:ferredoxin--NADP+ reductase